MHVEKEENLSRNKRRGVKAAILSTQPLYGFANAYVLEPTDHLMYIRTQQSDEPS